MLCEDRWLSYTPTLTWRKGNRALFLSCETGEAYLELQKRFIYISKGQSFLRKCKDKFSKEML